MSYEKHLETDKTNVLPSDNDASIEQPVAPERKIYHMPLLFDSDEDPEVVSYFHKNYGNNTEESKKRKRMDDEDEENGEDGDQPKKKIKLHENLDNDQGNNEDAQENEHDQQSEDENKIRPDIFDESTEGEDTDTDGAELEAALFDDDDGYLIRRL